MIAECNPASHTVFQLCSKIATTSFFPMKSSLHMHALSALWLNDSSCALRITCSLSSCCSLGVSQAVRVRQCAQQSALACVQYTPVFRDRNTQAAKEELLHLKVIFTLWEKNPLYCLFPLTLDTERELMFRQVLGECVLLLQPCWTTCSLGISIFLTRMWMICCLLITWALVTNRQATSTQTCPSSTLPVPQIP